MKVETRGKYPGVKIHLDEKESQILLNLMEEQATGQDIKNELQYVSKTVEVPFMLAYKMGKQIKDLLTENPDLLKPRSPEAIKAILVKEAEKAALQLKTLEQTGQFKELDKEALKKQLLNYVKD